MYLKLFYLSNGKYTVIAICYSYVWPISPYAIHVQGEIAVIIMLVNGTLDTMPNEFAKQKGF